MNRNDSFDSPLLLIVIIIAGIFFLGIPQKIEYVLEGKVYSLYCKHVEKKDYCDLIEERVKKIKSFNPTEEDKLILDYLHQRLLIPVLIINAVLFFLLYPKSKKKKNSTTVKKKPPKLFDNEFQKAVENLYVFMELNNDEINLIKSVANPYTRLALLMLVAKDKSNFASGEVANGINDEVGRKIIFSAGRPAIPPTVFPFYLKAEKVFSEYQSHQKSNQENHHH